MNRNPNETFTTPSLWYGRRIRLSSKMFERTNHNNKIWLHSNISRGCGFIILPRPLKREGKSLFWTYLTHGKMFVVEGEDNNRSEVMILSGQKTNCYVWIWFRGDNIFQQWKNWVNRETVVMPKGLLRVHTTRRSWFVSQATNLIVFCDIFNEVRIGN